MNGFSRRGLFAFFASAAGVVVVGRIPVQASKELKPTKAIVDSFASSDTRTAKIRELLQARIGEELYTSWFKSLEFESFDGTTVIVSVPVKFIRNWLREHYSDDLLSCCRAAFAGVESANVVWRRPGAARIRG